MAHDGKDGEQVPVKLTDESTLRIGVQDRNGSVRGKPAFFRVYAGVLKKGSYVYNSTKGQQERGHRIVRMHGNDREEVDEIYSGEIAAIVAKGTTTATRFAIRIIGDSGKNHVPGAGHRIAHRTEDESRPGEDGHRIASLAE